MGIMIEIDKEHIPKLVCEGKQRPKAFVENLHKLEETNRVNKIGRDIKNGPKPVTYKQTTLEWK